MPLADLHNCADVTTLFIQDFDYYGLVNTNSGNNFDCRVHQSVIPKSSTSYRSPLSCFIIDYYYNTHS